MNVLDEARFTELSERHRHELQVHSYRMLGNLEQAEDAVQEALLRAWKGRASFDASLFDRFGLPPALPATAG
jgi:RNA polymerase sigma-70 factor, ECF subfamily